VQEDGGKKGGVDLILGEGFLIMPSEGGEPVEEPFPTGKGRRKKEKGVFFL